MVQRCMLTDGSWLTGVQSVHCMLTDGFCAVLLY